MPRITRQHAQTASLMIVTMMKLTRKIDHSTKILGKRGVAVENFTRRTSSAQLQSNRHVVRVPKALVNCDAWKLGAEHSHTPKATSTASLFSYTLVLCV